MKPVPHSLRSTTVTSGVAAGAAASLALAAALLAGCAGQPTRYYTLASPADAAAVHTTVPVVAIEVAPIAVPDRLARPQLVVLQAGGGAELHLLEQHRWAASFETELRDAVASGVAARLGAVDLTHGGSRAGLPVWRIAVQVRQFDAVQDARVDAAVSWSVRSADGDQGVLCQWQTAEPVAVGLDALAQGAQRVTAALAARIAAQVAALQRHAAADCPR